ncbi:Uncharacterized protein BP5553_06816 [Venustampulla echinocandica]|uniref:triacylglycerol lipase n=1 Tax=Venustampulla echinocandica TaxID=2656787 RepID=A0A370TL09_9HELO|nr:Uncharacterized protein BP5553_06816 [Venustampulla echinocandica]RDL36204.1 Uncharacterized protein BP5553_06816 [Venustampulla echinocandica]
MASQDAALDLEIHSRASNNGPAITASMAGSVTNLVRARIYHCFKMDGKRYHAYKPGKHHLPNDELEQEGLDLQHHTFSLSPGHYNPAPKLRKKPTGTKEQLVLRPSPGPCKMVSVPATSASKPKHCLIAGDIWLLSYFLFLVLSSFMSVAVANLDSGWRVPLLPFPPPLIHAEAHGDKSRPFLKTQSFTLRHIYHRGATLFPDLHRRLELNPAKVKNASLQGVDLRDAGVGLYMTSSSLLKIWKLRDRRVENIKALLNSAQSRGAAAPLPDSAWKLSEVPSPDITDKETVVNLALMAANAYNHDNTDPDWEDVSKPFNLSSDVGWDKDGLRGHVFADETNSTIVLSIKGTSSAIFDGAETTTNDKINDNLFAGCCCGQGTLMAKKSCDCQTSAYTCNENCICEEMHKRSRYYQASIDLYGNITEQYPNANVWLTGHSLGGLVTSLLGLTFGIPVVTFESVPQALAASRLGIPSPPPYDSAAEARQNGGLWHFGHTADPVYMGTCNGASSLCTMAGYALQSQCHTGLRCVYDVVKDHNWRVSLATHGIRPSIKDVYRVYDQVPTCEPDEECVDCFEWKKDYSNITKTSTMSSTTSSQSSSSKTRTRTATCKTPGWWGCLDETTTIPVSTKTSTMTLTITTCKSYGWFGGCLESTTTTTTTTSTTTIPVSATTSTATLTITTCQSYGWFGRCLESTTATTTSTATIAAARATIAAPTATVNQMPFRLAPTDNY